MGHMVAFKRTKWYVLKQATNLALADPQNLHFQISPFIETKSGNF